LRVAKIHGPALPDGRSVPRGADSLRRRRPFEAAVVLALLLALLPGCAARRPPVFAPAREEEIGRALESWRAAVRRAETLSPSRLLYEAHLTQGLSRWPGTLAVTESDGHVEASLTGPFGSPVATYANGELKGDRIRTLSIGPEDLRSLLAGVWKAAEPQVRGIHEGDALLVWEGQSVVEGVLELSEARFRSLSVSRRERKIIATYSGAFDPWPAQISFQDFATGARMRLKLLTRENLR
jgi:hypothetical protein